MLLSCPINCQGQVNQLTLTHWLSFNVKMDICRIEVGKSQFLGNCQTIMGTRTTTVDIEPHDKPFYVRHTVIFLRLQWISRSRSFKIAILASGFSAATQGAGGGLALVDDIVYSGPSLSCNSGVVNNPAATAPVGGAQPAGPTAGSEPF